MGKPVYNLRLCEVLALACTSLNLGVNVATIAVNHDDVEELLAVHIAVLVGDDVGVADLLQQSDFILCVLQVFLAHVSCFHSFNHIVLSLSLVSREVNLAEASTPNRLYSLIDVHLVFFVAIKSNQRLLMFANVWYSSLQIQMI